MSQLLRLFFMSIIMTFVSCGANTIDDPKFSGLGTVFSPNSNPNIQINDMNGSSSIVIPSIGVIDNVELLEVAEIGRGRLEKIGSGLDIAEGTISLYIGKGSSKSVQGVFIQGDTSLTTSAYQVRIFASEDLLVVNRSQNLTSFINSNKTFLTNKVVSNLTVGALQIQNISNELIRSLVLICDFDGRSELCGGVELSERDGFVGNSDFDAVAHSANGGFRIYRSTENFNWIFETNDNYVGDDGPNLFFYVSTVDYVTGLGSRDGRYSAIGTSIIIDPDAPIITNRGRISKEVPGSANIDLKPYKTVSLWCEAFTVLFQAGELIKL